MANLSIAKPSNPNFDFCNGNCTLISIGFVNPTKAISKNFLNLKGSCIDTLTTPFWYRFKMPPTKLEEAYFECTKTTYDAIIDSIGVASGFTSTIGSFILLALVPFIILFKKFNKKKIRTVDVKGTAEIMKDFADFLLEIEKNDTYDKIDFRAFLQHMNKRNSRNGISVVNDKRENENSRSEEIQSDDLYLSIEEENRRREFEDSEFHWKVFEKAAYRDHVVSENPHDSSGDSAVIAVAR
jgi:hypothetical protein